VGKSLETNDRNNTVYKVTAVIKDIPKNSHFNFDFYFSMDNVEYGFGNYLSHNFQTYVLLRKGTDYKKFDKNFDEVIQRYIFPQAKQFMQISSMDEFKKAGNKLEYHLMPLTDIHLNSTRFPELGVNGNAQTTYIFSAVAIFILLIACINFMNLSTARSANRAKEVGIRKVLGTGKRSLIAQFLIESTLIALIALIIAISIAWLLLPLFNDVAAKEMKIRDFLKPGILVCIALIPLTVGAIAGSYPAFYLSSFNPVKVLKGNFKSGRNSSLPRKILVVIQFVCSVILMIGTIVVNRQIQFGKNQPIGFNNKGLITVYWSDDIAKNFDVIKEELLSTRAVESVSQSNSPPSEIYSNNNGWEWEARRRRNPTPSPPCRRTVPRSTIRR